MTLFDHAPSQATSCIQFDGQQWAHSINRSGMSLFPQLEIIAG